MYRAKSGVKNFSLYLEGGGPLAKNFFSSLNMYRAKSGVKNFSLYLEGGGPLTKNFFSSLNMYQTKSGVKNFSLYWGRGGQGPSTKNFFPVWTCIKPNLVSKIFPFTGGGGIPRQKIFFSSLNMYQAKSAVKNFSLYWDWVPPPQTWDQVPPPRNWDWVPPTWTWDHPDLDLGPLLPGPGTPPTWTWDPPPKVWTDWKYNLPSSFGCGR